MILDYSEYIINAGADGIENGIFKENNKTLFYEKRGHCPFCNLDIENKAYSTYKTEYPDWLEGSFSQGEDVWICPNCGWWEYQYRNSSDAMLDYIRLSEIKIKTAILRQYETNSKDVPIKALNDYIYKNPRKIYDIHHKKMEELTKSVFEEHYNCEVEMVGKSHDGGKDLILVNSDDPIIIQVKRRTKSDKVEPVSSIRELLGATLLGEAKSCIFVTTADHFSKEAIKASEKAIQKNIVESYDLVDYHRFIDMLNLNKVKEKEPWRRFISIKE